MTQRIPESLRKQVAERANFCCEYCFVPEAFLASIFHIDHVRSVKHGGQTELANLAYACPHCNQYKGSDVATFLDSENEQTVRFFNPRKDKWHDHFSLHEGAIIGITPIGRATALIFNVNQPERLILRKALIDIGVYRPE